VLTETSDHGRRSAEKSNRSIGARDIIFIYVQFSDDVKRRGTMLVARKSLLVEPGV